MSKLFDFFLNFSLLVGELRQFIAAVNSLTAAIKEIEEKELEYKRQIVTILHDIDRRLS